jgi:hypothetical protein
MTAAERDEHLKQQKLQAYKINYYNFLTRENCNIALFTVAAQQMPITMLQRLKHLLPIGNAILMIYL